jgi:hypothetical protein
LVLAAERFVAIVLDDLIDLCEVEDDGEDGELLELNFCERSMLEMVLVR